jgi:hypothetical protein
LAMALSSVSVLTNALRLRAFRAPMGAGAERESAARLALADGGKG